MDTHSSNSNTNNQAVVITVEAVGMATSPTLVAMGVDFVISCLLRSADNNSSNSRKTTPIPRGRRGLMKETTGEQLPQQLGKELGNNRQ